MALGKTNMASSHSHEGQEQPILNNDELHIHMSKWNIFYSWNIDVLYFLKNDLTKMIFNQSIDNHLHLIGCKGPYSILGVQHVLGHI
jgi:hypothetical protein